MTYGFTAENWKIKLVKHPTEDSFKIDEETNTIAVADGVTRDPSLYLPNTQFFFPEKLKKLSKLLDKAIFALKYPKPSPAKIAADIFTATIPEVLKDYQPQNRNADAIKSAFNEANSRIQTWNKTNISNPDYTINDLACCVASATCNQDEIISFGYICDCGVAIFDEKGNLKFRTENEGPDKHNKHIWQDKRLQITEWKSQEARRIIRKDYRNNPREQHSFGVLTGEETAMHYVKTGTQEVHPKSHLIVYSDGLEQVIFSNEFSEKLRTNDVRGIEKLCKRKVQIEGTLVHYHETPIYPNSQRAYEREQQMEQVVETIYSKVFI